MRGIGGPLLCMGDLTLEKKKTEETLSLAKPLPPPPPPPPPPPLFSLCFFFRSQQCPSPSTSRSHQTLSGSTLPFLLSPLKTLTSRLLLFLSVFSALDATDHSWTSLTLKLCTALDTANNLVQCTNTNAASLSEKIEELQKIVKRGDSAVAAAKAFYVAPDNHRGSFK